MDYQTIVNDINKDKDNYLQEMKIHTDHFQLLKYIFKQSFVLQLALLLKGIHMVNIFMIKSYKNFNLKQN